MKAVIRYCKCGCGQIIDKSKYKNSVYLPSHYIRKPLTEEQKRKRSEKSKRTCLERYGVDNSSKNKEIIDKIRNNAIQRNSDPNIKRQIQDKRIRTTRDRYGVDCITQSDQMKEKSKQTCLERYGSEYSLQNESIKEKCKRTCLDKYGVEYAVQSEQMKEKSRQTCLERYGVDNASKAAEVIEKIKQHNLDKYGVEWSHQIPEVIDKGKKTCLSRYGVDNVFKLERVRNKFKETFLSKYGVDNPTKCPDIVEKSTKWIKDISWNRIQNQSNWIPLFSKEEFKGWKIPNSDDRIFYKFKCIKCGRIEEFNSSLLLRCPICYPNNSRSHQENKVLEYIQTLISEPIISNDREILNGQELDIVIPSRKLAFEYNGLYWYSTSFCHDSHYHINKTKKCLEKGIQLIHIFEDDWIYNENVVKSRIRNLLGVYDKTVYARKCEVRFVEDSSYLLFLDENHIQRYIPSSYAVGLYYENELISLMTFGKYRKSMGRKSVENEYEMYRFCNKIGYHIPGAASKLFMFFVRNIKPHKVISYADRCWSQGNLYEKLGFQFIKLTNPNYWYVKGYKRENRYIYRKSQLLKLLKNFDEKQSEQQNMINNGYNIVYDCGSLLFEWVNQNI